MTTNPSPIWTDVPWLGFDTETTGVDAHQDRLVTAALVLRRAGAAPTGPDLVRTWLADPGVPIPERATRVHGISTEYAREHGRPVVAVLEELAVTLVDHWRRGFPVVVFNGAYDITLVESELARHGLATLSDRLGHQPRPVVDPLVLDRKVDRWRKGKRTLTDMAPVYGVTPDQNAHTAEVDVAMTLDVLAGMLKAHPRELSGLTCEDLHTFQEQAHAAWAEDFEAFLRSKGKDEAIARQWPLA
ncbi:DNA polymerase III subunit epsilon [Schaalia sp. 19OD2882]|uniref:exonuclease domain-containing protein n=1 Tax=Schaalia sp. 19OD2882 TaxID=2794089 RepID=UPI001C1E9159|nr:exonuclease domain-containing protein [Schaalia sp. 19OD2882]QWW19203.1 DNA polymerase III subunit epsilon [Schaalia sp. 19OD2882]